MPLYREIKKGELWNSVAMNLLLCMYVVIGDQVICNNSTMLKGNIIIVQGKISCVQWLGNITPHNNLLHDTTFDRKDINEIDK